GRQRGLGTPRRHEVDHGVPRVVGDPPAAQSSPNSFFVLTNSSVTFAITRSFWVNRSRSASTVRARSRCSARSSFATAAAPFSKTCFGKLKNRVGLMSCSSQTADTACPSSRTFLKIATLSAALCCRYRRARLLPMSPSSYVPDDYIPAGLGTPLSAEAGHARAQRACRRGLAT